MFFYIERVQYTDSDDERFKYYVLFEVFEDSKKSGSQYRIVGYASLYSYYYHPDTWRMRYAHTYVFPQYRRLGLGAGILHAINSDLSNDSKIFDITAETPAPELIMARDFATVLELIELDEFSKDKVIESFTKEKADIARKKWKMYTKQALRAYEILQLAVLKKTNIDNIEKFKEDLLLRIKKPNEKKSKEYKRMEMAFTPEEMDLITANHGDKLDEDLLIKIRDETYDSYCKTIEKLEKYSNKFNLYLKN